MSIEKLARPQVIPTGDGLIMQNFAIGLRTNLVGVEEHAEVITDAIAANGHVLLEGPPGVAKTKIASNLGELVIPLTGIKGMSKFQGASDKQPSDLVGSEVFNRKTDEFETRLGPMFASFLFLDEFNRNNTKTQAALNEAMQEGEVTIGHETIKLPTPFIILQTQNPNELGQGTQPTSDANLDRVIASTYFTAPTPEQRDIATRAFATNAHKAKILPILNIADLPRIQESASRVPVSEAALTRNNRVIEAIFNMAGVEVVSEGHRVGFATIAMAKARAMRQGAPEVTAVTFDEVLKYTIPHRIKAVNDEPNVNLKYAAIAQAIAAYPHPTKAS